MLVNPTTHILTTKIHIRSHISVAQLVATRDVMCRGRGSNPEFPTSPHIMCVSLATRLPDKKKNQYEEKLYMFCLNVSKMEGHKFIKRLN
jgi:hypothetical protein